MKTVTVGVLVVLLVGCQGFALLDQPPLASFTVTPSSDSIQVGDVVNLDASASSDPQGYPLTYEWTLTGPSLSNSVLSSRNGPVVTFTPDAAAKYVVRLQVTARVQSDFSESVFIEVRPFDSATLVTVLSGSHGSVTPYGPHEVSRLGGNLAVRATPNSGYQFARWVVEKGVPVVGDPRLASTTVSVPLGTAAVLRAEFEASAPRLRFLGWTGFDADPEGQLVSLDTGTLEVKPLGGDVICVALARSSEGILYGLGDAFFAQGVSLYRLNPSSGAVIGEALDLVNSADETVRLSSLAVAPNGTLWGLEAPGAWLVKVNAATGLVTRVGTSGVELSSLAISTEGAFFATDGTTLYQIDPKTGRTSQTIGRFGTSASLTSLTFGDGLLVARDSESDTSLYLVDTASGAARVLATFDDSRLLALVSNP